MNNLLHHIRGTSCFFDVTLPNGPECLSMNYKQYQNVQALRMNQTTYGLIGASTLMVTGFL